MGHQIDTFGLAVRDMLEEWGTEFALHRDCEYLGHRSKDMLQVLIEHKGEMPPRATGFKPTEIPPRALTIELAVVDIARYNLSRATVLRAFYCGKGRRGVERFEIANDMLVGFRLQQVTRSRYFSERELGEAEVRGMLLGLSRAA